MRIQILILILIGFASCKKDKSSLTSIPFMPTPHEVVAPFGYGPMTIPADNPMTEEGIALGRRLFYEKNMSADRTLSCASCHQQALSFTDGKALSIGIDGAEGTRSAPSLLDIGYTSTAFFWDGRASSLENQAIDPIENPVEMNNTWTNVLQFLKNDPNYPGLFRQAFGIKEPAALKRKHVLKALSQFERTIINPNASKFDRVLKNEATFTPSEDRGYNMFFDADFFGKDAECAHCHNAPQMTTYQFINNGIQSQISPLFYLDNGLGALTGFPNDNGKFKTPTLRNIELTAPYMHDGRFTSLDEVLDHYSLGGHPSDNTDALIYPLNLTIQQKTDIINYLKTLTDLEVLTKVEWSSPF